jgi:hypothetical protein
MKSILALFLLHIAFISYSGQTPEYVQQVMLKSSVKNSKLQTNEAVYVFEFNVYDEKTSESIIMYSIDDINGTQKLDDQNQISLKSSSGSHIFQFYYNDQYEEVYTDSLIIKSQFVNTYEVRLESSEYPVMVEKPVIYLYPKKDIAFKLSVNPKGKMAFTYPAYNDSWKGIAYPNGDIKIGDETFNYLFWEADQTVTSDVIKSNQGSIVKGSETISFLNDQLNLFGLNSKEKADFITFWGPNLAKNKLNYIYFVLNEEANYFGELFISPKPDNIYRIYILTCPIEITDDLVDMEPQKIKPMNRNGFTIVEWGGSIIDSNMIKPKLNL